MTTLMRRVLSLVILVTSLVPVAMVSAQTGLDGSACWQPGQLSVSGATMSWSAPPATIIDPAVAYNATLQTSAGTIEISLDPVAAPIATNNFICLALAGYYTGTDFHRIAADFLIQGGDPSGTGTGGPGYTVPSDPTLGPYHAGSVAMANATPGQNGSQFFIAAGDLTGRIPANYPVFGHVSAGIEVVQAISQGAVQAGPTGEQTQPVDPTVLLNVTITTGAPETSSVGPPLTSATATTQPAAPAVSPTPASASTDPQARPGASTLPSTDTTSTAANSCEGLDEYTTAFDDAYTTAAIANPDALAFFLQVQSSDSTESIFNQMTPEQAVAVSGFYSDFADGLALITPPAFAAEWHQVQIEIFQTLAEFTANIATQGVMLASMQVASRMDDLLSRDAAALQTASAVCADFGSWAASEQG